jgi:membrane protein
LLLKAAAAYAPALAPLESHYDFARFGRQRCRGRGIAVHLAHVAAGRTARIWRSVAGHPGVLWLICGFTFGHYLAEFAYTYVNYYAGLASAMIALVFLYYGAWIFVYGIELNAGIARLREAKA